MADSNITQTTIAYGAQAYGTYSNQYPVLAAGYTTIETLSRLFVVPNISKREFQARVGAGSAGAYPTGQTNSVADPIGMEISDVVNVQWMHELLHDHMGQLEAGGDIVQLDTGVAWQHHYYKRSFDADGRQFMSRPWICKNNGAEFIYTGGVPSTFQIQQTGIADPTFNSTWITSGNFVDIGGIGGFGTLAVPAKDETKDMLGAETIITYNDGAAKSLQGRWISFNWQSNNNVNAQNLRAGLPRIGGGACPSSGWYRDRLLADDETYSLEVRFAHDDVMNEHTVAKNNTPVTDFNIAMNGVCIPATTNDTKYGVKINTGKCYFRQTVGGDDNNDAVIDMQVFGVRNGSYYGAHKIEVINGDNAAETLL